MAANFDLKTFKEKFYFDRFNQQQGHFPASAITMSDRPDVIITSDSTILGIDIREIHRPKTSKDKYSIRETKALIDKIVDDAENKYTGICKTLLHIRVKFSPDISVPREDKDRLSSIIADAIHNEVSKHSLGEVVQIHLYQSQHHIELVESITGLYHPELPKSCWSADFGFQGAPILISDAIQNELNEKEKKIVGYRNRCSVVWLLLVETGEYSSHYEDELPVDVRYSTSFDRVYLLRNPTGEVIELPIIPIAQT